MGNWVFDGLMSKCYKESHGWLMGRYTHWSLHPGPILYGSRSIAELMQTWIRTPSSLKMAELNTGSDNIRDTQRQKFFCSSWESYMFVFTLSLHWLGDFAGLSKHCQSIEKAALFCYRLAHNFSTQNFYLMSCCKMELLWLGFRALVFLYLLSYITEFFFISIQDPG